MKIFVFETGEEVGKSFRDFFKPLILSLEASVFSVEAEKNYHSLQLTNRTKHSTHILFVFLWFCRSIIQNKFYQS